MGQGGIDVVLVRKSGPVQTMTFKTWWIYFLFLVLVLMLIGLGAGSYLLHRQQLSLSALSDDMRLMMLRTERLEALVQEQETREVLALQTAAEKAAAEAAAKAQGKPQPKSKPKATEAAKAEAAPPSSAAPKAKAEEAPPTSETKEKPPEIAAKAEPKDSDEVEIRNINRKVSGGKMEISFQVANKQEPSDQAMGYVSVVARGKRGKKPWIEAWPPQRLTPLGRPLNYRRGTPFSVQRYRSMKASFDVNDKEFNRLEFVVFSRQGELLLVHILDIGPKDAETNKTSSEGDKG
ncbi:MAG: hypothetical protein PVG60_10300 [Desulfarculaceae bacterium]